MSRAPSRSFSPRFATAASSKRDAKAMAQTLRESIQNECCFNNAGVRGARIRRDANVRTRCSMTLNLLQFGSTLYVVADSVRRKSCDAAQPSTRPCLPSFVINKSSTRAFAINARASSGVAFSSMN